MGDEKRHENQILMKSLFGAASDESEDEAEAGNRAIESQSEEEGEGEAEGGESGGETEADREGSEGDKEESEAEMERNSNSQRRRYQASEEGGREEATSAASASEGARSEGDEQQNVREVQGDSDEDEIDGPRSGSHEREASDIEETNKRSKAEDEAERYNEEEEERYEPKLKEKNYGPALQIDVPLRPPPTESHNMNLVKVSNIMDIEQKPFDPKTYVEDSTFVTDESGHRQRLRLEENVVRWRTVRNRDGSRSYESNARFVKWSDGSMQLLVGSEVLDLAVQDGQQDQSHLFIRHSKDILQAQGRLARKMRFMPSSLTSKSHRLLTALVDSQHKKIFKVKKVVTDVDPEKDKEQKEKAAEQRIRSKEDLQKKQERQMRKYPVTSREREPELSSGYLEEALEEEDEGDYDDGRHSRRYHDQLEEERREKRILNAKKASARQSSNNNKEKRTAAPLRTRREMLEDSASDESDHRHSVRGPEGGGHREEHDEEEGEGDGEREEAEEIEEEEDDEGDEEEEEEREKIRKRKEREKEEEQPSPPRKSHQRRKIVVSDSDDD